MHFSHPIPAITLSHWTEEGWVLLKKERWSELFEWTNQNLEKGIQNIDYLTIAAKVNTFFQAFDNAADCYDAILQLNPYHKNALINRAELALRENDLSNASLLAQKVAPYMNEYRVLKLYKEIEMSHGNYDCAIQIAEIAQSLEEFKDSPSALNEFQGWIYIAVLMDWPLKGHDPFMGEPI